MPAAIIVESWRKKMSLSRSLMRGERSQNSLLPFGSAASLSPGAESDISSCCETLSGTQPLPRIHERTSGSPGSLRVPLTVFPLLSLAS